MLNKYDHDLQNDFLLSGTDDSWMYNYKMPKQRLSYCLPYETKSKYSLRL